MTEVRIFDASRDPSWDAITNLEHQIDYKLLNILGPNDMNKPSPGIATTPTVLWYDFLDMEEASVELDELLVDMKSTLNTALQCPTLDYPVIPPPTNIFKGPKNLGELSPSSTPSLNPKSLQSSSPLALPSKPVSSAQ